MVFLREIPIEKLTDQVMATYEHGQFVLKWKEDSVEVWVDVDSKTNDKL